MRKQTQKKREQTDKMQGQELKCDVCGIVLHQYAVSEDGKKIVSVLIEQDTIARGVKFTMCRGCKDVIERISTGGKWEHDAYDVQTMLRYLNAKLNQVIEALCAISCAVDNED